MTITLHNIATSPPPQGFSHATAASGNRIVHISVGVTSLFAAEMLIEIEAVAVVDSA